MIAGLSAAAADVLMGQPVPYVDDWDLDRLMTRLSEAIDAAPLGALAGWAFRSAQDFPSMPPLPALEFTLPCPEWPTNG